MDPENLHLDDGNDTEETAEDQSAPEVRGAEVEHDPTETYDEPAESASEFTSDSTPTPGPVIMETPTPAPTPMAQLHYKHGTGALKYHGAHFKVKLEDGQTVVLSPGQKKYVHVSAHEHPDVVAHPRIVSKLLPNGAPAKR